jgi:hypothetical protein
MTSVGSISRRRNDHSAPLPGRFIALEGPDGIGKTTLAAALGEITYDEAVKGLPGDRRPLAFVSRRQVSGTSDWTAKIMEHVATVLWHSGDSTDLPDSFWVSAQVAWFTAHATNVLEPLMRAGFDVIVDGWIYKFWSKLLLQGYARADLETIFDRQTRGFRASELGMHAGYTELNRASFVEYQQQGSHLLHELAEEAGWPILRVWSGETVEETTNRLMTVIGKEPS